MRKVFAILFVLLVGGCSGVESLGDYPEGGIAIIGASFAYGLK